MKKIVIGILFICSLLLASACGSQATDQNYAGSAVANPGQSASQQFGSEGSQAEKNGDVYIIFTADVHCGVDQGFGYAGVQQIRDTLEGQGYTTLLVDDGDFVQGELVGSLSKGEKIVELMNDLKYDVAIPGNHEFDYGVDQFMKLVDMAQFPVISCNLNKQGELLLAPYIIKEAAGMKIAFVGVTTPKTITASTPQFFQNEEGEYIYGFMQDESGEGVYQAVQNAVDAARAEGVDYVYLIAHLGNEMTSSPWTYADVVSHTNGIDVVLDGHSHDTEQVVMKNKDGEQVVRSACGTKLNAVGFSHISAEKGIEETNIWSWPNKMSAVELLHIENSIKDKTDKILQEIEEELSGVVAHSDVILTMNDPEAKDGSGNPVRMIRRAETNLGDFCADAVRAVHNADIGISGGGNIRANIEKGDITYKDIISVFPWGNNIAVVEASGQQIMDALEWGARNVPEEEGGFLQVSGLTYEVDVTIPSSCVADVNGLFDHVEGARRVKNVKVAGEPIDPAKTYTVAGTSYILLHHGDGCTAFDGANVIAKAATIDNQALIDYIVKNLGGTIGEQYADPYGEGRIVIIE